MSVDCGFLFPFRNPDFNQKPWHDLYRDDLGLAAYSEELGLDHIWLTEHHFIEDGYSPSLMPIATALAAKTHTIRIGTFVLLLPLHNTVRLAEDIATADAISGGRIDIGLGLGYRVGEFKGMGIPTNERGRRFKEQLPLLRQLLDGDNVTLDGKYHNLENAQIMPPAVQKPVPLWVGARGDKALDRAAKLGCHLAGVSAEHRRRYRSALEKHGRTPDDYDVSQMVLVYVNESKEKAWQDTAKPINHMLNLYQDWAIESGDDNNDDQDSRNIPSPEQLKQDQSCDFYGEPAFVGTPEFVTEGLKALLKRSPCTHLVMMGILPGVPTENTKKSMELFAREVMPNLK